MHRAKRLSSGEYEYRGFRITDSYSSRWQIMIGDIHGWLAAQNTLRQAKERIDHWYAAAAIGEKIAPQFLAAVESVSRDSASASP